MAEQLERSIALAISNAIVKVYKNGYGKGATRAQTRILDDTIVVELDEILTPAEKTLVDARREDQVRETRQVFDQAHRDAFIGAVEEITRRKVRAFLSQVHFDPDVGVVIFLLEHDARDE
jgi:uncharacterized protein YbcI